MSGHFVMTRLVQTDPFEDCPINCTLFALPPLVQNTLKKCLIHWHNVVSPPPSPFQPGLSGCPAGDTFSKNPLSYILPNHQTPVDPPCPFAR